MVSLTSHRSQAYSFPAYLLLSGNLLAMSTDFAAFDYSLYCFKLITLLPSVNNSVALK